MHHADQDMLLRRLRVFMAVVDYQGVSEAAQALGVSQPAVSTQMKRLEAELGIALFRRNGRRLAVNDQGRDIAVILRRGLGELDTTLNAVRDISRTRMAPIRFGFSAPQLALDAADAFRRSDPRAKLELHAANSTDLFAALDSYELDVIMVGLRAPKRRHYHCQFYRRQSIAVLVPRAHIWAARRSIGLNDLAQHPLVLREEGSFTRDLFVDALSAAHLTPNIAFEVSTREAVAEAVRRGFGLGPVLDGEAPRGGDLVAIPLEGGAIAADEYLLCHAGSMNYGPVRRFFSINDCRANARGG